jgi:guanine deaminase
MSEALELASQNVREGRGGPFGAIVVKDGRVIARGANRVTSSNDPTAHAEVVAIREACRVLGTFQLTGCTIYASCEPCPMCLGALFWARPDAVYFANTQSEAAEFGFDDSMIYGEVAKPPEARKLKMIHLPRPNSMESFHLWTESAERIDY